MKSRETGSCSVCYRHERYRGRIFREERQPFGWYQFVVPLSSVIWWRPDTAVECNVTLKWHRPTMGTKRRPALCQGFCFIPWWTSRVICHAFWPSPISSWIFFSASLGAHARILKEPVTLRVRFPRRPARTASCEQRTRQVQYACVCMIFVAILYVYFLLLVDRRSACIVFRFEWLIVCGCSGEAKAFG